MNGSPSAKKIAFVGCIFYQPIKEIYHPFIGEITFKHLNLIRPRLFIAGGRQKWNILSEIALTWRTLWQSARRMQIVIHLTPRGSFGGRQWFWACSRRRRMGKKSWSLTHGTSSISSNGHVGSAVIIRPIESCDENWPLRHHLWTLLKISRPSQHGQREIRPAVSSKLRKTEVWDIEPIRELVSGTPADGLWNLSTAEPK